MPLLAALASGLCLFMVVATATGHGDQLSLRLPGRRRARLDRAVWLRQAGVNVTPAQFWAVSAVLGAMVELACWTISGSVYVGLVIAVGAALFPRAYFSRRRDQNLAAVIRAWPDGIGLIVHSTETRSIHQGLLVLAAAGPPPLREAFARYADLARLDGCAGALAAIRNELADPISDRVIEILLVAHDQGQHLAMVILAEQAVEITEDLRTAADNRTARLEPVLTARIAFLIPFLTLVLLCWQTPSFASFYRSTPGFVVVSIFGLWSSLGLVVARKLARDVAEPRVLVNQ